MSKPIVFGSPEANNLKPPRLESCPFCGSGALIERDGTGYFNHWIECGKCGSHGPPRRSAEQARESWNQREVQP